MSAQVSYEKDTELHIKDEGAYTAASDFVGMSRWQIIRRFWQPILFAAMASFLAVNDSFCFAIGGGLLANTGFLQVFGDYNATTGTYILDAHVNSVWVGDNIYRRIPSAKRTRTGWSCFSDAHCWAADFRVRVFISRTSRSR